MSTYLLAPSARVAGVRYERGNELPDHATTTRLLEQGWASHELADLLAPEPAPSVVNGHPKASERSVTPAAHEVLVTDGDGVHVEVEATAVRNAGASTVTSSSDGPTVTKSETAKPAARTGK